MLTWAALRKTGCLTPLDLRFGEMLRRREPADCADLLAATGALASRALRDGHACIDLARRGGTSLASWIDLPDPARDFTLPDADEWQSALAGADLLQPPDGHPAPLVLEHGAIYLSRHAAAEQRIAEEMCARATDTLDEKPFAPLFHKLFPDASGLFPDNQALAATSCLQHRLGIVTGGPGTGKTTTAAKILALLATADPAPRIALAAPTGKAATRLADAVAAQASALPLDAVARDAIPHEAFTLHRLLGYNPAHATYKYTAAHPLPVDLVLIDETSMVDLPLFDALLQALPLTARLILLGDRHQLPSIRVGQVFADLCDAAETGASPALSDCLTTLAHSWRFAEHPEIGALASAIQLGDDTALQAQLTAQKAAAVSWQETMDEAAWNQIETWATKVCSAATLDEAWTSLCSMRVLTALRRTPRGVERINAVLEDRLRSAGHIDESPWYPGRPILVTTNAPRLRLFNGDIGLCWPSEAGPQIHFPDATSETGWRALSPSRLPAHGTAWAMTVHKAQGSEFDRVLLLLPEAPSPVLTRAWLYTGVTRAREQVGIIGATALLSDAIAHIHEHDSRLATRLATL